MKESKLTRRQLLRLAALAGTGAAVAACAPAAPAPAPTEAPKPAAVEPTKAPEPAAVEPTKAPEPAAVEPTEAPEPAAAAPAGDVPRNKTLVLGWGADQVGIVNPWAAGYTHQDGNALLWEPLFYFGIFADKEIPWLAESGTYNAEFTQLKIKIRKEAKWSDGTPDLRQRCGLYT